MRLRRKTKTTHEHPQRGLSGTVVCGFPKKGKDIEEMCQRDRSSATHGIGFDGLCLAYESTLQGFKPASLLRSADLLPSLSRTKKNQKPKKRGEKRRARSGGGEGRTNLCSFALRLIVFAREHVAVCEPFFFDRVIPSGLELTRS
jgi:hypothetical protein